MLAWLSAVSFSFPEAPITVLTVQLDPPPSWLLPFLFFILSLITTKCRQPAQLCAALTAPCLPGDPSLPLRQAFDAGLYLCIQLCS